MKMDIQFLRIFNKSSSRRVFESSSPRVFESFSDVVVVVDVVVGLTCRASSGVRGPPSRGC